MIVVAIIALLARMAVPSFLRARKRSQGTTTLEPAPRDRRAKDQYAIENGKGRDGHTRRRRSRPYLKAGTKLYTQLPEAARRRRPCAAIAINAIDTPPQVSRHEIGSFRCPRRRGRR